MHVGIVGRSELAHAVHLSTLRMRIGTVLTGTFDAKFAVNLWMEVEALLAIAACGEVLALFCWVYEGAVVLIHTMWKVFAPDLFLRRLSSLSSRPTCFLDHLRVDVMVCKSLGILLDLYPLDAILRLFDDHWGIASRGRIFGI